MSAQGVHVDPRKIEVVENWPQLANASEVGSLLGLGNYFKRFILGYSMLNGPSTSLASPKAEFSAMEMCLTKDC